MEPGYGKWFQSAFCVFSLQYDMIDNLTLPYLPFDDLLRPTVAIVFETLVRGPCLNGLPFYGIYSTQSREPHARSIFVVFYTRAISAFVNCARPAMGEKNLV